MIRLLPLDAPILPGKSLGGFELGRNIGEYDGLGRHGFFTEPEQPTAEIRWFEARFTFGQIFDLDDDIRAWSEREERLDPDLPPFPERPPPGEPAVEVTVDIRDGVIVGLAALGGYAGVLLESIRTGMTYSQVASLVEVSWSYGPLGRVITGQDGVWLRFERDDYESRGDDYVWPAEELADSKIEAIRIFLPERTGSWGRVPLYL